ncbi:glycosyltransferase [Mycolicibacterium frederiksbergense]|uniref:glycosyltransferase n=1 Tax=Mycolicibacterium frederiksbergense TaxID=117567 RepID=UPI00265B85EC|nr:glycosyltransferase [Mycolicibacterium frederiksbergense]MBX9921919.1 glycosyltransferase [Mycolicibacterium frederiksbergense]MDO0974903.1 glycosyltransferase [Mycolicibacterium frederiksbergense]
MRVLLYTFGSRGDVEPLLALALELQNQGAEALVCAPPDFTELLAAAGVPMVPTGPSVRELVHVQKATHKDAPALAAALVAGQFDLLDTSRGCDAIVATGLMPAGMRSIAELVGVPYRCVMFTPQVLPSPDYRPLPRPGKPFPEDETDNRVLWDLDAEKVNALYGPALNEHRKARGLAPVGNVRDHTFTRTPWLASDPVLSPLHAHPGLDVVQTGAWIVPDERPLTPGLEAFLDSGEPPVYVGFGSVTAPERAAEVAIEAIRAHGRRVLIGSGWAGLTTADPDCLIIGEVNQQALFPRVAAVVHHGGAGTTTTAARAGAPQVVIPQIVDQPYWAGRVADLGIGVAHDDPTPIVHSLAEALRLVLTLETRNRAIAVAGTIRTDGAATAARALLGE